MTAAMYRGIAPRGCAESSFRITPKTLGMTRPHGNAQNVLLAGSVGDANGGIQGDTSPIGVSTATGGLASPGDCGAAAFHFRRARFRRCGRAIRDPRSTSRRDPKAPGAGPERDLAAAFGRRAGSR